MASQWPDLAVLELLSAIGTAGSLSAAARNVGMAQPNATRAIRRLETDLGLSLVRRDPSGSRLTHDGEVVAEWANAVLRPARQLLMGTASMRTDARSRLTVAASRTIAEYAVPGWLTDLRREHPDLQVTLTVANSEEVCQLVLGGTADVGFVEAPGAPKGLRSTVIGYDDLYVVAPPTHPWARRRRPVTAEELAATPLVVRESGSGTRSTLEAALRPLIAVPPAVELASNEAVRISVISGAGPAVLSELAVRASVVSGDLSVIPVAGLALRRRLRAVWTGTGPFHGPAGDLVLHARASARRSRRLPPPG